MSCSKDFFKIGAMLRRMPDGSDERKVAQQVYEAAKQQFIDEVIALNTQHAAGECTANEQQKPIEVDALEYVAMLLNAINAKQIDLHEQNHDEMCAVRAKYFTVLNNAVAMMLNAKQNALPGNPEKC